MLVCTGRGFCRMLFVILLVEVCRSLGLQSPRRRRCWYRQRRRRLCVGFLWKLVVEDQEFGHALLCLMGFFDRKGEWCRRTTVHVLSVLLRVLSVCSNLWSCLSRAVLRISWVMSPRVISMIFLATSHFLLRPGTSM